MAIVKIINDVKVTMNEDSLLSLDGVIYLMTFPNGSQYIGQTTKKLSTRLSQHFCSWSTSNKKLKNTINKYKEVEIAVLESGLTVSQLNSFEEMYIRLFKTKMEDGGLNSVNGGLNYKRSQESIDATANKLRGKKRNPDSVARMAEHLKGNKNACTKTTSPDKIIALPDNKSFKSLKQCCSYYNIPSRTMLRYLSSGKIHELTGQIFTRITK